MKIYKRIASLALVFTLIISTMITTNASEKIVEANQSRTKALKELKENTDKFEVIVIGEVDTESIKDKAKFTSARNLKSLNIKKGVESVWISADSADDVLNNPKEVEKVLSKGISVYFIGLTDENILSQLFTDGKMEEENADNVFPDYQYITFNGAGEYFIGKGFFEGLSQDECNDVLLVSSWNRRNDEKYVAPIKKETVEQNIKDQIVSAISLTVSASSGDFDVDAEWDAKGGWSSYEYSSTYGDVNEWKACYHYNDGYDDYYAIIGSTYMTPADGFNYHSDYLEVTVDCDNYDTDAEMFDYSPESQPTSNTYTLSVGAGTNGEAEIGASWDVVENDLDVYFTGTSMSSEIYKVKFDYNYSTTYSQNESSQDWCVVAQRDSASSCAIYNKRMGYFTGTYIWQSSSCGTSYKTTIIE